MIIAILLTILIGGLLLTPFLFRKKKKIDIQEFDSLTWHEAQEYYAEWECINSEDFIWN